MKIFIAFFLFVSFLTACGEAPKPNAANTIGNSNATSTPAASDLKTTDRPQSIKDKMAARGEQDQAVPVLKVTEPKANAVINSSTVNVKLDLSGDLKGYMPGMEEATHTGNHVHVILDNQAYEAYYNIGQPFELRNVLDGDHILRVFPSRPWHESYKNDGAFKVVKFTVKNGGGDPSKATTASNGQTMANANTAPTPEGKEMKPSNAGAFDASKPLLTYSRPKGEYKGADADAIMIDFWLSNAKLIGDGGEYRVQYTVNGGTPKFIEKWEPIWLSGWSDGKNIVKLELVDKDGNIVTNGDYNSTEREITITK